MNTARNKIKIVDVNGNILSSTNTDFTKNLDGEEGLKTLSMLFGRVDNDTVVPVKLDGSTQNIQIVSHAHAEVHGGDMYTAVIIDDNINSNPLRIKMEIPDQAKRIHMQVFGVSSGESTFTITEDPTGGATGGSSLTAINKRRDSSNTTLTTLTQGVTAPTGGTVLTIERHGFDKDKISGESRDTTEWILGKTGAASTYIFELESGTSDVVGNLLLIWYEHTDKN